MKKRILTVILSALAVFSIVICAVSISNARKNENTPSELPPVTSEPSQPTPDGEQVSEPVAVPPDISERVEANTVFDSDGTVLINYSLSYPELYENSDAARRINEFYESQSERTTENIRGWLVDSAREFRSFSEEIFQPFEIEQNYAVSLNDGRWFSCIRIYTEQTSGVHPSSVVYSDNFDMKNGGKLVLGDLFSVPEEEYTAVIEREVLAQIADSGNEDIYFDNYRELVAEHEAPDFFLSDSGLGIIYQQYDIAPYSSGIPEFIIPFNKFKDILSQEVLDEFA